MSPRGNPHPPGEPVPLPPHLNHGESYVYRHYKCRCTKCQKWRRDYDQKRRDKTTRRGKWGGKRSPHSGWYVCANQWAVTFAEHAYNWRGACTRCGRDRQTEEFWERKWQESKP